MQILNSTRITFLLVVSLYIASRPLTLPDKWLDVLKLALVVFGVIQAGLWGSRIIAVELERTVQRRITEDASSATTLKFIGVILEAVLWAVLVLWGLNNLGIDITALVAGLGVGGIAVALAVQKILGDLFGSFSIVLDKPFVIGDFIVLGDDAMGTVEHIGIKSTRIRSLSGEQLIIANSDLLGARIRNFKRMYQRRVVFSFKVDYATPVDKLASIPAMVRRIIETQQRTRFDRAHLKEYGDLGLVYEVVYYVLDSDFNIYMDIHHAINLAMLRGFASDRISLARAVNLRLSSPHHQMNDGDRREESIQR